MVRHAENGRRAALRSGRWLDRAGFGARPGDVTALAREDPEAWLAARLRPGPDPRLDERLTAFPTLAEGAADRVAALEEQVELPRLSRRNPDTPPEISMEAKRAIGRSKRTILSELAGARMVRAVHGENGLREVMIDFWSNHFSIFGPKGFVALLLPDFQREVIEPHALGRFEDMLVASARSPAMLVYLDNWRSSVRRKRWRLGRERGGLNENYARELLELHTLGLRAGYTQQDVVAVARVFTGWSLAGRRDPRFAFHDRLHDDGRKVVLGEPVPGAGEDQGVALLRRLARHPSTARHIATKLARRFVSDTPPPVLVDRAAVRFLETEGDIAATVAVVLRAPELADPANRKLKTPLRFVASAIRLEGGTTDGGRPMLGALDRLGEVPGLARTPAGHPETMPAWLDGGAMLDRMAFAFALADGFLPGTRATSGRFAGASEREAFALRIAGPEFQWA